MRVREILIGALLGTMIAGPVLAQSGEACLQHNRMKSWRALDDRTLVFTDIRDRTYTVHMQPACIGVTHGAARLIFRTWQNLECLPRGEIIGVQAPGYGQTQCSVASVQAGAPGGPAHG